MEYHESQSQTFHNSKPLIHAPLKHNVKHMKFKSYHFDASYFVIRCAALPQCTNVSQGCPRCPTASPRRPQVPPKDSEALGPSPCKSATDLLKPFVNTKHLFVCGLAKLENVHMHNHLDAMQRHQYTRKLKVHATLPNISTNP